MISEELVDGFEILHGCVNVVLPSGFEYRQINYFITNY